jgi:hypothetical protein
MNYLLILLKLLIKKAKSSIKQSNFRNKKTTYFKLFRILLLYNALYTSLILAAKDQLKLGDINEVLSLTKSHEIISDSQSAHLSFLFQHDILADYTGDINDYNNLRLVYFVCEHINELEDPFTILDDLLFE